MPLFEEEPNKDIPGIWPIGPIFPEITELALDMAMPAMECNGEEMTRASIAFYAGRLPTITEELLDILDLNLYSLYSRESCWHLSAPRYEPEYAGMSVVDLLRFGLEDKAYSLVLHDVHNGIRIETEKVS